MRTIVDLPEEQVRAVALLCEREGISRAEAVRRGLAKLLAESGQGGWEQAFGAWKGKKLKSRDFVKKLRAEWNR
jgi:hypothetical protein